MPLELQSPWIGRNRDDWDDYWNTDEDDNEEDYNEEDEGQGAARTDKKWNCVTTKYQNS